MTKVYNESGINKGLIFSAYRQSGNWIVNITNDDTDSWHEKRLHYSYTTEDDVLEWIEAYVAENHYGEKYEVRI